MIAVVPGTKWVTNRVSNRTVQYRKLWNVFGSKNQIELMQTEELKGISPNELLPAGVDTTLLRNPYTGETGNIRKGTIGAVLQNVYLLDTHLSTMTKEELNTILHQIELLLPGMRYSGMFDVFDVREWLALNRGRKLGRAFVGALYLQTYPELLSQEHFEEILAQLLCISMREDQNLGLQVLLDLLLSKPSLL